jgi:putative peptidoglycan lipid II flippase
MFQQLPETLIGTALGTAILPSLSLFYAEKNDQDFFRIIRAAIRLVLATSFGIGVLMAIGLGPLIQAALGFELEQHQILVWTLRGFLVGLTGHCLLEVANRAFYAQQEPLFPLLGTILNLFLYLVLGIMLYRPLNAPGISLTDSISFTVQALFLLWLLYRPAAVRIRIRKMSRFGRMIGMETPLEVPLTGGESSLIERTLLRSALGAIVAGLVCLLIPRINFGNGNILVKSIVGLMVGTVVYIPFIIPEIKLFRQF